MMTIGPAWAALDKSAANSREATKRYTRYNERYTRRSLGWAYNHIAPATRRRPMPRGPCRTIILHSWPGLCKEVCRNPAVSVTHIRVLGDGGLSRSETPLGRFRGDFDGLGNVGAELRRQLCGAGEAPGIAQTVEQIDRQSLFIQLALKADEMGFDFADLLAEGWIGADVEGSCPGLSRQSRACRVDAVARNERADVREIGGGKAEGLAAVFALGDGAADLVRPAEQLGCGANPSLLQLSAHTAARDGL